MKNPSKRRLVVILGASVLVASIVWPAGAAAQAKTPGLVKELTTLLQQRKLDSIAARHPSADDQFVAALYFPELLLVVTARTSAPAIINEKLARQQFRDVYIDLNSASIPESRVMISDGGADGLSPRREPNQAFDSLDMGGKSVQFDGNWREDRMSEEAYMKSFDQAETGYVAALEALIAQLKKAS